MVTHAELLTLADDPTLIKGIYTMCDQWCAHCGATAQCLAYRCDPAAMLMAGSTGAADRYGPPARLFDRLMTEHHLAAAEGRRVPAEIEIVLSGDRARIQRIFSLRDPLERLGGHYMMTAEAYLTTRAVDVRPVGAACAGPTPIEVFTWFHSLVPARIFRAIVSEMEARDGADGRHEDALATAKMALVGLDRSLEALTSLATEGDDPRLELLASLLRRLGPAVERRFRGARRYLRPGLDDRTGVIS